MKKIVGLFIIALISVVIADFLHGIILTLLYTPDFYSTSKSETAPYLKYIIPTLTFTVAFGCVYKLKEKFYKMA